MLRRCTHLRMLHPAYFALVMATGIFSITSFLHGYPSLAKVLLGLNLVQYVVLVALYTARFVFHRREFLDDLGNHQRGSGFFTVVAGSGVLGAQCFVVGGLHTLGVTLSVTTMVLWFCINYTVFSLMIVKADPPPIEKGINGGWLVSIVATQSAALVCFFMGTRGGGPHYLLAGLAAWCLGVMLYLWIISFIIYRYLFYVMDPNDLSPPYWINMGAVAISTLVGSNLVAASSMHPFLGEVRPFLKGMTFVMWSTATWWIPMLVILGFWRHVVRRFPMRYDPLYWGMVFPLCMYSAATFRMAQELQLPEVLPVAKGFLYIGGFVWSIIFVGMLKRIAGNIAEVAGGGGQAPLGNSAT
ncbi:tellurite resistance/C4-dicarboxylate transporter family protein [Candidatus Sumerlaeota bacterium]|nr:tellurite resistance/C4-dicarboxylate transporter family protein [Candidatus Sumerlaeota bacterium]